MNRTKQINQASAGRLLKLAAVALALVVGSVSAARAQCVSTTDGSKTAQFTLFAGQTIPAGSVSATVVGSDLIVTYQTTDGWTLTGAQLWIGQTIVDLPQTKTGNPTPGKFPYKASLSDATTHAFTIPLSALGFTCPSVDVTYYLAAHADVRRLTAAGTYQTETGWSAGGPITDRGNWATFSTLTLTCACGKTGGEVSCETAFARSRTNSITFQTYGFDRWGWTNGPFTPGAYTLDLWAGAGRNDLTKGMLAGYLDLFYNGSTATVTYNTTGDWWIAETQLYVGNDVLPTFKQGKTQVNTVAPGQYPYQHGDTGTETTDLYTVNATGDIYVIAHATVCRIK